MQRHTLIALLAFFCLPAHAAPTPFPIEEAMKHPAVQSALKPDIKIVWKAQKFADEIERTKPDSYTRVDYGASFAAKKERCKDIFASAMQDIIRDASLRGYDVIEAHGIYDDKPADDNNMYICDIGFRGIDVALSVTFIQTRSGAENIEKAKNNPVLQATIRDRKLGPNSMLMPLGPILESPEAAAHLRGIKVHWGNTGAPAFSNRFGPEVYDEDASIRKYGREGACKKAVLNALENMADDVRDKKFNGLVMVRSYYENLWAPDDQQVECDMADNSAKVQLVGTLVTLK